MNNRQWLKQGIRCSVYVGSNVGEEWKWRYALTGQVPFSGSLVRANADKGVPTLDISPVHVNCWPEIYAMTISAAFDVGRF